MQPPTATQTLRLWYQGRVGYGAGPGGEGYGRTQRNGGRRGGGGGNIPCGARTPTDEQHQRRRSTLEAPDGASDRIPSVPSKRADPAMGRSRGGTVEGVSGWDPREIQRIPRDPQHTLVLRVLRGSSRCRDEQQGDAEPRGR